MFSKRLFFNTFLRPTFAERNYFLKFSYNYDYNIYTAMQRICPEELKELLNNLKNIGHLNETQTKQTIILKTLDILGWDVFNAEEVIPEFSTHGKRVDYALKQGDNIKVFIEVKKIGEDLNRHQEQLLQYAFQEGIDMAVLTNGITWWFYLPLQKGNWKERKFCSIEINDAKQSSDSKAKNFCMFLSREHINNGQALSDAENEHKKQLAIKKLPSIADQIKAMFTKTPIDGIIELILDYTHFPFSLT